MLEKTRYIDKEKTQRKINELVIRINELETQKGALETALKESRKRYQSREHVVHLVNSIDVQYKWRLQKLRKKEKGSLQSGVSINFIWIILYFVLALIFFATFGFFVIYQIFSDEKNDL